MNQYTRLSIGYLVGVLVIVLFKFKNFIQRFFSYIYTKQNRFIRQTQANTTYTFLQKHIHKHSYKTYTSRQPIYIYIRTYVEGLFGYHFSLVHLGQDRRRSLWNTCYRASYFFPIVRKNISNWVDDISYLQDKWPIYSIVFISVSVSVHTICYMVVNKAMLVNTGYTRPWNKLYTHHQYLMVFFCFYVL